MVELVFVSQVTLKSADKTDETTESSNDGVTVADPGLWLLDIRLSYAARKPAFARVTQWENLLQYSGCGRSKYNILPYQNTRYQIQYAIWSNVERASV